MWSSPPPQAWQQLSLGMTGRLLFPAEDRFDPLRRPATNRYQTSPPQAIARCAAPADVAQGSTSPVGMDSKQRSAVRATRLPATRALRGC
jgi:hypothetical protein